MIVFPESIESAFGGANLYQELTEAFERHNILVTTHFPVKEISEFDLTNLFSQVSQVFNSNKST